MVVRVKLRQVWQLRSKGVKVVRVNLGQVWQFKE